MISIFHFFSIIESMEMCFTVIILICLNDKITNVDDHNLQAFLLIYGFTAIVL